MVENVLSEKIRPAKVILNIALALISIGIIIFDRFCSGTCSYISGDLFGLDLRYFGLAFMAVIMVLSLVKNNFFLILTLSMGLGVEIYLVGFQVWFNTYCPYCLAFGGVLMLLFLINISKMMIKKAIFFAVIGLILLALFFNGSVTPALADKPAVPVFGKGKIQVRLYTDYFCPPCRALEPTIEPVITELVTKNIISLIFVDTPFSKASPVYARYFLYIMNGKNELKLALLARSALMEASLEKIMESGKLEEYLRNKGIKFKSFDVKPSFDILNGYISGDKINSTPTCVIFKEGKMEKVTHGPDIVKALERLKS